MTLPNSIPPLPNWDSLSEDNKTHYSKVFAVHAAMIENMDYNIGRLIQFLKDTGEYDNTLIVFASDNGTSEPTETPFEISNEAKEATSQEIEVFLNRTNNTAANLGNPSSNIGYGWRGASMSASPFSGFKSTQAEGGIRAPFVIKEPGTTNNAAGEELDKVKAFVHVTDITPTFLEYAGVEQPGDVYQGRPVHPIMGKSIKPFLEGAVKVVHPDNKTISQELFGNRAVFMGDWKALYQVFPAGAGQWRLFNLTKDIGETTDLAQKHPDILNKMVSSYDTFAKEVGIVPPEYPSTDQDDIKKMFGNETQIIAPIAND